MIKFDNRMHVRIRKTTATLKSEENIVEKGSLQ